MNKEELKAILEMRLDNEELVQEVLESFIDFPPPEAIPSRETEIQLEMMRADDWRRRAALAALKISLELDKS